MRAAPLVIMLLAGCAASNTHSSPPSGEEYLDLLLASGGQPLATEPDCNVNASARTVTEPTVSSHLAALLAGGGNDDNRLSLSSDCEPADEGWTCSLTVTEENPAGDYIASSTVVSDVTADGQSLVPGTLRCF